MRLLYILLLCPGLSLAQLTKGANPIIDTLLTKRTWLAKQPPSVGRDTTIWLTTNLLTERLCNQHDPRAEAYKDTLKNMLTRLPWAKGQGLYWRAIGKWHDANGQYKPALTAYLTAIDSLKKAGGDTHELTYAYILAAFVLSNNGQTATCQQLLRVALPLARHDRNTNNLCWILDYYGDYNYYEKFGVRNYRKALSYYLAVEKLLPRATSPNLKADNPHMLAACYARLGNDKKASPYRQKALAIALSARNYIVPFAIYSDLTDISASRKEYAKAIAYADTSLRYAQRSKWPEMIARAERTLAYAYRDGGRDREAFTWLDQYHRTNDSLKRTDVEAQYNQLQAQYKAAEKDLTISKLTAEKAIQTRNYGLALAALSVLLVGGLVYVNRRLRQVNQSLALKNNEIETALTRGQTLERKRVAGELHDSLNTKVAAIRWRLEAMPTKKWSVQEQATFSETMNMVSELYADIRLIAHNMLPDELATKPLADVLQKLVGQLNHRGGIRFQLVTEPVTADLSPTTKFALYSIVLELTNNILRHANARRVWLSLSQLKESIVLSLGDDGAGFNVGDIKEGDGMGLKNIESRVQAAGGQWSLTSQLNQGTNVTVTLPLE